MLQWIIEYLQFWSNVLPFPNIPMDWFIEFLKSFLA